MPRETVDQRRIELSKLTPRQFIPQVPDPNQQTGSCCFDCVHRRLTPRSVRILRESAFHVLHRFPEFSAGF